MGRRERWEMIQLKERGELIGRKEEGNGGEIRREEKGRVK